MIGLFVTVAAIFMYWNNTKRYLSIFLVFVLITGGFQLLPLDLMVLPAIGITKTHDWALVYVMLVMALRPEILFNYRVWRENLALCTYVGVLCLLLLYNLFYVDVEAQVAIRVFRNYAFFILLMPMAQLDYADFIKIFRLIVYFTSFAAFLYCLQPLLGRGLLNGAPAEVFEEPGTLLRFYNLPYYVMPATFIMFAGNNILKKNKLYYVLFGINVIAIILSQHRNMIFAAIFCYVVYLFVTDNLNIKKILVYGAILVALFFPLDSVFNNKFSNGIVQLTEISKEVTPLVLNSADLSDISTSEYRKLHFLERYNYAKENVWTMLFGVGFLTEDAAMVKKMFFNIGLINETGDILQIDTSDITWSMLIIHFGLVGIFTFIFFYLSYIKAFYHCRQDRICVIGILYIFSLLIHSFYGIDIILPHSMSFLMLIISYRVTTKLQLVNLNQNEELNSKPIPENAFMIR